MSRPAAGAIQSTVKASRLFFVVATTAFGAGLSGQTTVTWNFGAGSASLAASSGTPVGNLTVGSIGSFTGQTLTTSTASASGGYTGASGNFNGSFSAVAGTFNVSSSSAFTVTLTPASGYDVTLTGITFGSRSTASGPTSVAVRTSTDGFAASAYSTSVATTGAWTLVNTGALTSITGTATNPLTVRLYGSGGSSAASGNWRVDDVAMSLAVSAVPEPSTYAAILGAIAFAGSAWRRRVRKNPG